MKYINKILSLAILATATVGCSEDFLDDKNHNPNNTHDAPARFVITDVMTSTAFNVIGADLTQYAGMYIEHETGTHNQFYQIETRVSPSLSSTVNNSWGSAYMSLKNAKLAAEKTLATTGTDAGNNFTRGVANLFVANNLAIITDMFGDTPWTEACDWSQNMTPGLDTQEDIYADVHAILDSALIDLKKYDVIGMKNQDLIYKGDSAKWNKTANALKARYTMRLLNRSNDKNADLQKVIDFADASFQSAAEQCSFNMYGVGVNINPTFSIFFSRTATGASQSMYDKLADRNDPRIRRSYFNYNTGAVLDASAEFNFAPIHNTDSLVQSQGEYTVSLCQAAEFTPTHIISYHEVLFLKAEAQARLGNTADAKATLALAVKAAIANSEAVAKDAMASPTYTYYGYFYNPTPAITIAEVDAYIANEVNVKFDADPLKEIMMQKYIAFWNANGESVEAYNDVRRIMAEEVAAGRDPLAYYEFQNGNNAEGKFPLRFAYGNDDTTANPNVQEAYGNGQYVYDEPVWWAGGVR